jgi:hypothetical protein
MAETADKTYKVKSDNTADTTPNSVAVVNDGTGDRQVVVLGAGDGSTNLNDGSLANPINSSDQIADLSVAIKSLINVLISPPWMNNANGNLRVETYGPPTFTGFNRPISDMSGLWNSASSATAAGTANFSPTDSFLNPLGQSAWANNIRERIA